MTHQTKRHTRLANPQPEAHNLPYQVTRMSPHKLSTLAVSALLALPLAAHTQVFVVGEKTATADVTTEFHPTHVEIPDEGLTERGHLDLIRNLIAEQGFAHRELPLGAGLQLVANGNMNPSGEAYKRMLYQKGQSAAPGDRVEISGLKFEGDRLVIDFNGGPYAKHRFLSHISFDDMPLAQEGPIATGFRITLVFEGGLPEISAAEIKALLDPVVDFKAKSAAEAFANTLAPKVRDAVNAHEILVGMNRRTVIAAVGEPKTKHREHTAGEDADSPVLEEWIYGEPPSATQFVRFRNGKVVRLEIAEIGKPVQIRERNEVDDNPEPSLLARTILNGDAPANPDDGRKAAAPPTLRLPGEKSDTPATLGKTRIPDDPEPQKIPGPPAADPAPLPTQNPIPSIGQPPSVNTQPGQLPDITKQLTASLP
jgi:hypothetical protein